MGSPSSGQPPGIRGGVGGQRGSVEHEVARATPVAPRLPGSSSDRSGVVAWGAWATW